MNFIDKIKTEALRHLDKEDQLYLYGSRARNDNMQNSDWDLLIITSNHYSHNDSFDKYIYPLVLFGQKEREDISVQTYSQDEWNEINPSLFYLNVMKDRIRII